MTTSNNERTLGGSFEQPNYGDPVSDSMYNMYWLWDDDDKHPGVEFIRKTNSLRYSPGNLSDPNQTQPGLGTIGFKMPDFPDTARQNMPDFKIADYTKGLENRNHPLTGNRPSPFKTDDSGLMADFNTGLTESLAEEIASPVVTGLNADSRQLTTDYLKRNPTPYPQPAKTNETLLDAHNSTGSILHPKTEDRPAKQSVSAIATRNHNRITDSLPIYQTYFNHARTDGIASSLDAESDFTHTIAAKAAEPVVNAYDRHYENAAASINQGHTNPGLVKAAADEYHDFVQKLAGWSGSAIAGTEEHHSITEEDQKLGRQWSKALELGAEKLGVMLGKNMGILHDELPQRDWVIDDPDASQEQARQHQRNIQARQQQSIDLTQVHVPDDPAQTFNNIRRFCYETVLGEYIFDVAIILATRGVSGMKTFIRPMKLMNKMADHYDNADERDEIRQQNIRHNRQFRFGSDESEAHARLNAMADTLDRPAATAMKLLIKTLPDVKRREFIETYDGVRKDLR